MSESKQSSFIKLISPEKIRKKSSEYDAQPYCFSIQNHLHDSNVNPYDQQKTQRMRSKQFPPFNEMSPVPSQFYSSGDSQQLEGSLIKLTNQIDLQKQAMNRANQLIEFLTQENNKLNAKIVQIVKDFQATQMNLQQQLQKANNVIKQLQGKCSRNETAANSFIAPKYGKTTPIKIYGRGDQPVGYYAIEGENASLQQISKLLMIQNVFRVQKQLNNLNQLSQEEGQEIKNILEQQKYLQEYVQDEVFSTFTQFSQQGRYRPQGSNRFLQDSQAVIMQVIRKYQEQIINWEHYANNLKKQLIDCISFIEKSNSVKELIEPKQRQYSNQDLIKYICREVCRIFNKRMAKSKSETEELKEILDELIDKIKRSQSPMLNYLP